jgi:hypothetical protein
MLADFDLFLGLKPIENIGYFFMASVQIAINGTEQFILAVLLEVFSEYDRNYRV